MNIIIRVGPILKKIIRNVLIISMAAFFSLSPYALAGSGVEKYSESAAFQDVFGISSPDDVKSVTIVYSDGRSAHLDLADAKSLLNVHWGFSMERFTMPKIQDIAKDYYFNFYMEDGTKRTLTLGSFFACAGFGEDNYIWYRPYIGNARNALYTACSSMAEKYKNLAVPSDEQPFYPENDVLGECLSGASEWALPEIKSAASANILPIDLTTGYTQPISRENFCRLAGYMICRLQNKEGGTHPYDISGELNSLLERKGVDTSTQISFPDDEYPGFEVCALYRLGVIGGRDDGCFDPDGNITRQEAAKILYNCAKLYDPAQSACVSYADNSDIADWAKDYVYWVTQNDIMNGVGDGRFAPKETYTTEQSIATVLRLFQHIAAKNDVGSVAARWAEAMKMRDGRAQYLFMSRDLESKSYEMLDSSGWVTGVSSPWIARYEVRVGQNGDLKLGDNEAVVIFEYATSAGYAGTYEQTLTFVNENGWNRIDRISEAYNISTGQ
ncbi:MAG: S-layer homology domain-containing protein [Bacillota bacterium]|nr:S-layer homology domain-containing protein [Bacillota bacterium]